MENSTNISEGILIVRDRNKIVGDKNKIVLCFNPNVKIKMRLLWKHSQQLLFILPEYAKK
jgi:hypothetical protein